MRRHDREIIETARIEDVLKRATVCRLAMADGETPYIVPLCFGYAENRLYFHCATAGRKIDILRRYPRVCFEVDCDQELIESPQACGWSMRFRSVIGEGRATLIDDPAAKRAALDIIMRHYSERDYSYPEDTLAKTLIIRVDIERMTGKQKGW